jgi:hypothetical protein
MIDDGPHGLHCQRLRVWRYLEHWKRAVLAPLYWSMALQTLPRQFRYHYAESLPARASNLLRRSQYGSIDLQGDSHWRAW